MAARTAVVAGTANAVQRKQNQKWDAKDQAAYDAQQAQVAQQAPPQAAAPAPAAEPDYMAELGQLSQLKDQGIITEEEFEAKKKQILGL